MVEVAGTKNLEPAMTDETVETEDAPKKASKLPLIIAISIALAASVGIFFSLTWEDVDSDGDLDALIANAGTETNKVWLLFNTFL